MKEESLELTDKLRLNAEMVIGNLSQHAGFQLGFDAESVEWVDGFIERQRSRDDFDAASSGGLVNTLGSFLGECMCQALGGVWRQQPDGALIVEFSDGNAAYPFNKVAKHLANGSDDSIHSFFRSAAVLFHPQNVRDDD